MLSYIAFGGKLFDEGQSPLSGRLGEKVTGGEVTMYDDALDRRTLRQPFDYEGVPRKRTVFIEGGVAKAVATNFYRAKRWAATAPAATPCPPRPPTNAFLCTSS